MERLSLAAAVMALTPAVRGLALVSGRMLALMLVLLVLVLVLLVLPVLPVLVLVLALAALTVAAALIAQWPGA